MARAVLGARRGCAGRIVLHVSGVFRCTLDVVLTNFLQVWHDGSSACLLVLEGLFADSIPYALQPKGVVTTLRGM